MTTYHSVCSGQSLHKCGEPQVEGSSRVAGPKKKCGAVERVNYDSAWNVLSENLAYRIIIHNLVPGPPKETSWKG